ncbi:hypothetical protein ABW20_dc0107988 [Dactylellina cionopaga]|nr:hypothetical protein ABW20_dc0107988 [Dactylellina cionopaga]
MARKGDGAKRHLSSSDEAEGQKDIGNDNHERIALNARLRRTRSRISLRSERTVKQAQLSKDQLEAEIWKARPEAHDKVAEATALLQPLSRSTVSNPFASERPTKLKTSSRVSKENAAPLVKRKRERAPSTPNNPDDLEFETPVPSDLSESDFEEPVVSEIESDAPSESSTLRRRPGRGSKRLGPTPTDRPRARQSTDTLQQTTRKLQGLRVNQGTRDHVKAAAAIKGAPRTKWAPEAMNELPPISSIQDIFLDMTKNNEKLQNVAARLNGRPLRVATMCSGTESPLLALGLIITHLKSLFNADMAIEHVFSCEIEPWKQAYIERNFQPPILFRDVCELGGEFATTAYGAKVRVPGNCDLLVAGTSCVDYSSLNNHGKGINDGGESGRTFWGMFRWVEKHRPKIVILENVCKAPWGQVVTEFEDIGYAAGHTRFDTKNYYIPHTRQRGYLVAFNTTDSSLPAEWVQMVNNLTRPASVSFESFLLEADDPRVLEARQKLLGEEGGKAKTHDWTACEIRHTNARTSENLGRQRPFTDWQENGVTKYPDCTWQEWGDLQVDRVNDLVDISYLRNVKKGLDISYKARLWNLSQNVDRDTEGKSAGVSQCLTPTMIPFLTARGGPMIGVELLSLQGLPVEQLLLTRESEANLKDLAGNAMSSTVVGTAIIAALITGNNLLEGWKKKQTLLVASVDTPVSNKPLITLPKNQDFQELDLAESKQLRIKDLLKAAARSASMCLCEGRTLISSHPAQECRACGHRTCTKCGGKPAHVYRLLEKQTRIHPTVFESTLKDILPMLVKFKHEKSAVVAAIQHAERLPIQNKDWTLWQQHVSAALSSTFTFKTMKRRETWVIDYDSPVARLQLLLESHQVEWRVYVKIDWKAEEWRELRRLFAAPVAQMIVNRSGNSLLQGNWRIGVPGAVGVDVSVEGKGQLVDSWERTTGVVEPTLADKMVYSELQVSLCNPSQESLLDDEISGKWELLPKCGTANRALHRKVGADGKQLFLFLDPKRLGDEKADSFVISNNCKRLTFEEHRSVIAKFDSVFRPNADQQQVITQLTVDTFWVAAPNLRLKASGGKRARYAYTNPEAIASHPLCNTPTAFLISSAPLTTALSGNWPKEWRMVDEAHAEETFSSITWLVERMKSKHQVGGWMEYERRGDETGCTSCAPPKPAITWRAGRDKSGPIEDPEESAVWERAMKARPAPWVTALKVDEQNILHLHVGLNLVSLCHRATDLLPSGIGLGELSITWKLTPNYINPPRLLLPDFNVESNRSDSESVQPPGFKLSLRPEQLRSLSWMLAQESSDAAPFVEEEIVEALHSQLAWKVNVKASRTNNARGGVLADAVGYGKTAIVLGLLAHMKNQYVPPEDTQGRIALKATLVIVPGHLSNQWESEIKKFTGGEMRVVNIKTVTNLLSCTVNNLAEANVIIVAGSLFKSPAYLQRLAELAGGAACPAAGGRRFQDWLREVTNGLKTQAEMIQAGRTADAISVITEGCKTREYARAASKEEGQAMGRKSHNRVEAAKGKAVIKLPQTSETEDDGDELPKRRSKPTESGPTEYDERRWKLRGSKSDWRNLVGPPLELFYFNRLVLDEFTYCSGMPFEVIPNLLSTNRWVLSGTPPMGDFADIKKIARFLGIFLGIDDDTANSELNNKNIAKERSAVESFQAFKELRTAAWHKDRHTHAQRFLHQFMRQNVAEIDEIPWEEHFVPVKLPAAERAVYIELDHHLKALEMNVARRNGSKSNGDRENRLNSAIGTSSSAEEALLKSCCHFSLNLENLNDDATAGTACDFIIVQRNHQLKSNQEELATYLRDGLLLARRWNHPSIPKNDLQFIRYLEEKRKHPLDDADATEIFRRLLQEAKDWAVNHEQSAIVPKIVLSFKSSKPRVLEEEGNDEDAEDENPKPKPAKATEADTIALLKSIQFQVSRLLKELVGRCRSLRFFQTVREAQTLRGLHSSLTPLWRDGNCTCGKRELTVDGIIVSSSCGHSACSNCMAEGAGLRNECPEKRNGCHSRMLDASLVPATSLGAENDSFTTYGAKLDSLVDLLKTQIPLEERVLVFVQFPDLLKKVGSVLQDADITVTRLAGSSRSKAADLTIFQSENSTRVLLLEVMGETAAGANLTMANHVVFLSPLLTVNEQQYQAAETQAIGRARRYGQKKTVHIWRLVAKETIDYKIYSERDNPVRH